MNFEPIQQDIIKSFAKNQLVSAGAGSGKTTVMIEKIANLIIEENIDISSLLVVTFTVLSANEMKSRLQAKLKQKLDDCDGLTGLTEAEIDSKKREILSKIDQLQTASIDTIDGFNSKTIKKYFYEIDLNPNMQIISDTTKDFYINRAMKQAIDTISKDKEKVGILLDLYGGNARNFENLEQQIFDIYNDIINLEDYVAFIKDAQNEYLNNQKSEQIVNQFIISKAKNLIEFFRDNYIGSPSNIQSKFTTNIEELEKINSSVMLKNNLLSIQTINLTTFTSKQIQDYPELADVNEEIKGFKDFVKWLKDNGITSDYDLQNETLVKNFSYVIDMLEIFMQNYQKIKTKNNLMDFNDISRKMLELLANDRVRKELQQRYKYIFIDEYQDVNPLQDKIMSMIADEDTQVFTVGDVKQSIYGFRGSSPEWFLQKYNNFKDNPQQGQAFDMNINYRSNPLILNFINEIFVSLMTKHTADIDYKSTSQIQPRREDIVDDKPTILLVNSDREKQFATGLYSVKNDKGEAKTSPKAYEAGLVASLITSLIGKPFYDANLKQNRTLSYKDIAILSRSTNDENAKILIDVLRTSGIRISLNNKLDTKASEGIKLILSVLKCVNFTADDVDYLATFMALTDIQLDDIMAFRQDKASLFEDLTNNLDNPQIALGFEKINLIRLQSYVSTNSQLIRYILNNMQLKNYLLSTEYGDKELKLIEQFISKLSVEDSLSLTEFVTVVESNVSRGNDYQDIDDEDSVVFETIHKSKGLEYPVVILFNASKQFSYLKDSDDITFNSEVGIGVNFYDLKNRQKSYSLPKYAIKIANSTKGYKEELRLLYVALTRAKNKLYITGQYSPKGLEKKIKKTSYLNMILSCYQQAILAGRTDFNLCKFEFFDEVASNTLSGDKTEKQIIQIKPDFEYPNQQKFEISLKNSVTGLNTKQSEKTRFDTKIWTKPQTQYLLNEDRAIVGTHYHKALELLDLTKDYQQSTNFDDVDYGKIKLAHKILSDSAKGAIKIKKEADFMMYLPYNCLVEESSVSDKVLVQGVLDLLLEFDDHFDIVDYKFSTLPASVLKQKYAEQLRLYKLAVEKAYNKKVGNVYIYSINTAELV